MRELHVAIIGAGLGGLALAQALRRSGIPFDVYERDPTPDSRIQGYRIRIDAEGQRALAAVLPPNLYALFRRTASTASTAGRFITPQLEEAAGRVPDSWHTGSAKEGPDEDGDLSVNRQTLREILLCGIKETVHFGCGFENYRVLEDGRVALVFDNGDSIISDVVVGADGVNSRVRKQLAPDATPNDTGTICIYGKSGLKQLDDPTSAHTGTNVVFADGFSAIMDEMRFRDDLPAMARSISFGCDLTDVDDYLYWAIIGPSERLGIALADGPKMVVSAVGEVLSSLTGNWHPVLRKIICESDLSTIAVLPVRNGRPEVEWVSGPVTILGDAAHAMSPAGGVGANTAQKDACALADALVEARKLQRDLVHVIADYESAMREWGLSAVVISNHGAAKLFALSNATSEES